MLDIFKSDAFSTLTLTDDINKMPHVPGRIGRTGIFNERGVPTTQVMIEEKDGFLTLIPNTQRGGPATQYTKQGRAARSFLLPHLPLEDRILASEIQDVRQFGSDNQMESVQSVVNDRMTELAHSHDATVEYGRIGAIKGVILDADGTTVIYNLFNEFEVSQTVVSFELDVVTTKVRNICLDIKRTIAKALGVEMITAVRAFCGANFFQGLISHDNVAGAYERWQNGEMLRNDPRAGFPFGEIIFEEYVGQVGTVDFIHPDEAHFVPIGVNGLFRTYFGPGDFLETVNTIGLPRYAKVAPDEKLNRFVDVHTQSNPLSMCLRPDILVKGKFT